ncbi:MAG: hypothetical protein JWM27_2009 [Gemmatimonadetes bacterium]|nr:hypothetical protein [Gemmatimonadota bacterium]
MMIGPGVFGRAGPMSSAVGCYIGSEDTRSLPSQIAEIRDALAYVRGGELLG